MHGRFEHLSFARGSASLGQIAWFTHSKEDKPDGGKQL